jgi:hypothetical protein
MLFLSTVIVYDCDENVINSLPLVKIFGHPCKLEVWGKFSDKILQIRVWTSSTRSNWFRKKTVCGFPKTLFSGNYSTIFSPPGVNFTNLLAQMCKCASSHFTMPFSFTNKITANFANTNSCMPSLPYTSKFGINLLTQKLPVIHWWNWPLEGNAVDLFAPTFQHNVFPWEYSWGKWLPKGERERIIKETDKHWYQTSKGRKICWKKEFQFFFVKCFYFVSSFEDLLGILLTKAWQCKWDFHVNTIWLGYVWTFYNNSIKNVSVNFLLFSYYSTVKPLYNGHPRDSKFVAVIDMRSLFRGSFKL